MATGKKAASDASKALKDGRSSARTKEMAASDLSVAKSGRRTGAKPASDASKALQTSKSPRTREIAASDLAGRKRKK
jgi:hypothetical protein